MRDYNISPSSIQFNASHIFVLKDSDGNELRDIRTSSDNESVADQILAFVREKAADENCCLHCSLAGGRKTMGLYLGFALQLYGRPGDALSHVLVHPPAMAWTELYKIEKSPPALRGESRYGILLDKQLIRIN